VKICDFGINLQIYLKLCQGSSKVIDPTGKNTPYIVSRYYRAPELILCITKYDAAIDMWGKIYQNIPLLITKQLDAFLLNL